MKAIWSKKSTSKTQDKLSTKKHSLSSTSKKSLDLLNDISHLSQYKNIAQSLLLNYYYFILFFWCFFDRFPLFLVFNGVFKIFYFYFFSFRSLLSTFLHLLNSFWLSLHFVVHPPCQRSILLLLTFQHILKSIMILTLNLFQFAHLSNTIHLLMSFTGIGMHPDDEVVQKLIRNRVVGFQWWFLLVETVQNEPILLLCQLFTLESLMDPCALGSGRVGWWCFHIILLFIF